MHNKETMSKGFRSLWNRWSNKEKRRFIKEQITGSEGIFVDDSGKRYKYVQLG